MPALMSIFAQLLQGWQAAGYQLVSLKDYFENLDVKMLPRHCVNMGSLEGRSGTLAVQGQEFLAASAACLPNPTPLSSPHWLRK